MKRIKKSVTLVLIACFFSFFTLYGVFNSAYNFVDNKNAVFASERQEDSALTQAKNTAINYINTIRIYNLSIGDFEAVRDLRDYYISLINSADNIPEVNRLMDEGYAKISTLNELERLKGEAIQGALSLNNFNGYILYNFAVIRDYYSQLVLSSQYAWEIDILVGQANAKFDAIKTFENSRKDLTDYIDLTEFQSSLKKYEKILESFKAEQKEIVVAINGQISAEWAAGRIEQELNALLADISSAKADYNLAFDLLTETLLNHRQIILDAISTNSLLYLVDKYLLQYSSPILAPFLSEQTEISLTNKINSLNLDEQTKGRLLTAFEQYADNVFALDGASSLSELNGINDLILEKEEILKSDIEEIIRLYNQSQEQIRADIEKAQALDDFIATLNETSDSRDIRDARKAYNNLTENQKSYITRLDDLVALEQLQKDRGKTTALIAVVISLIIILLALVLAVILFIRNDKKIKRREQEEKENENQILSSYVSPEKIITPAPAYAEYPVYEEFEDENEYVPPVYEEPEKPQRKKPIPLFDFYTLKADEEEAEIKEEKAKKEVKGEEVKEIIIEIKEPKKKKEAKEEKEEKEKEVEKPKEIEKEKVKESEKKKQEEKVVEKVAEDESDEDDEDDGQGGQGKDSFKTYEEKQIESSNKNKILYSKLKNELMSHQKMTNRISKRLESFNIGRLQIAKIGFSGQYLRVYLPLKPKDFDEQIYNHQDVGNRKKFELTPMALKLRNEKDLNKILDLINDITHQNELEKKKKHKDTDYVMALRNKSETPLGRIGLEEKLLFEATSTDENLISDSEAKQCIIEQEIQPLVEEIREEISLDTINEQFTSGESVDLKTLKSKKLISRKTNFIEITSGNQLDKLLDITADKIDLLSSRMVLSLGGSVTILKQKQQ